MQRETLGAEATQHGSVKRSGGSCNLHQRPDEGPGLLGTPASLSVKSRPEQQTSQE